MDTVAYNFCHEVFAALRTLPTVRQFPAELQTWNAALKTHAKHRVMLTVNFNLCRRNNTWGCSMWARANGNTWKVEKIEVLNQKYLCVAVIQFNSFVVHDALGKDGVVKVLKSIRHLKVESLQLALFNAPSEEMKEILSTLNGCSIEQISVWFYLDAFADFLRFQKESCETEIYLNPHCRNDLIAEFSHNPRKKN